MKRFFLIMLALFAGQMMINITYANEVVDERFHQPHVLQKKPLADHQSGMQLAGHADRVNTGTVWQIFTAMEGVHGHANANLTGVSETFDFLESFVVVREEANVIQAVHQDHVDRVNLLDGHEENTWWFDKEDMLLWRNSMFQDEVVVGEYVTEFYRKAMIINRLDMTAEEIVDRGFFDQPTLYAQRLDQARSFTILFVYREHGDYLLLGEQQRVSAGNIAQRMRGWVHKQFLSEWNHHLALEMNWENAAEREPAGIFSSMEDARTYTRDPHHDPPPPRRQLYTESPPYVDRAVGEQNRFFVLTEGIDMDNQTPKVGHVGPATFEGLEESECIDDQVDPDVMAKIRERLAEGVQMAQQVNILFVVDATASMEPYGNPIMEQLETTMRGLMAGSDTLDVDLEYNLGAFIFRDEGEPKPYEVSNNAEWTDDIQVINDLLEREMRSEFNTGANPTHPEALYHAMHHSVELFSPNSNSTNYMIVIGDAGDNPDSYTHIQQEDVVDILDAHNFNLLAYQMHHREDFTGRYAGAYDKYRMEINEIIEALALRRNQQLHRSYDEFMAICQDPGTARALDVIFDPFPLSIDDSAYDSQTDDVFGVHKKLVRSSMYPIIAQFVWPDDDGTISTDDFGNDLKKDLVNIAIQTAEFLRQMTADGYSADEINTARLILHGLRMGLSLEEILVLIFEFDEVYEEGFTAYAPDWLDGSQLYHYVAFLGHNQSQNIARYIDKLIEPGTTIQAEVLRERIYNIWQRMLVRDLGLISESDFHNQTIARNLTFLTGLPAPETYKAYSNADILTPSVFADSLLMNLCMDLIVTRGHLLGIVNGQNVFDRSFFRSYRGYIDNYLQFNQIDKRTMDIIDDLTNYFGRQQYAAYPQKVIHPLRSNQSQFRFYWVDARLLPSEVSNPSEIILSVINGP